MDVYADNEDKKGTTLHNLKVVSTNATNSHVSTNPKIHENRGENRRTI